MSGIEKIGKSTFAAGAPTPVFIPIRSEEGIDDLPVAHFPTAESFDDVMAALQALHEQKHDYETVVIDSVSTLEPLVWDAVCKAEGVDSIEKVGGGYGKGYVEAVQRWRLLMSALDALREQGLASILIGHVAVRTFADPTTESYDQYQLDLNKRATAALMRWSDCILFANCRPLVRKEEGGFSKTTRKAVLREERCLFTQEAPGPPRRRARRVRPLAVRVAARLGSVSKPSPTSNRRRRASERVQLDRVRRKHRGNPEPGSHPRPASTPPSSPTAPSGRTRRVRASSSP